MQSVDEVLSRIAKIVVPVAISQRPLDAALHQVLAADVMMAEDSPPFDRAILDGFAVRAADVKVGNSLELAGHVNAGVSVAEIHVLPGQCVAINTGAPMPLDADAVLMVEHSQKVAGAVGRPQIMPQKTVAPGYGIQKQGADARAGEAVLAAGRRLSAADLAVCASAGVGNVSVRALRAALLVSGDELVPAGTSAAKISRGQIRDSNHPMLTALLTEHGGVSRADKSLVDLGTAGDDAGQLRALLRRGLEEVDLLVVSGGMSMGTRDLIPPLLRELGVTFHVEKVRIKPGKPFILGVRESPTNRCIVAGLPGNPVSAFVTFQRFVRPIIAGLLDKRGQTSFSNTPSDAPLLTARTAAALPANGDREFYQPCTLTHENAALTAHPLMWKGSADLFTLAQADGVLIRAADSPALAAGEAVRVLSF